MNKTIIAIACAAVLGAAPTIASAGILDTTVNFETTGQSMWGEGAALGFNDNRTLLATSWDNALGGNTGFANPRGDGVKGEWPKVCVGGSIFGPGGCVGGGEYVISDGWNLGQWGASLTGQTNGSAALKLNASLDSGSVSVKYPIKVQFDTPDARATPGALVQITSSYSLMPHAELRTQSPTGGVKLTLDAAYNASVNGTVCTGGCNNVSATLANGSMSNDLVSFHSSNLQGTAEGMINDSVPYAISGRMPSINTVGGAQGNTLTSSGSDQFLSGSVNVSQIVSAALGIPLNGSVNVGGVNLGYKTVDLAFSAGLGLTQDFSFDADPWVRYDLSTGQSIVQRLGDTLAFEMPQDVGGVTVTPTVFLEDPELRNLTRLTGDIGMDLDILQLNAGVDIPTINVFGLGTVGGGHLGFNVGPAVALHPRAPLGGGLGLYDQTWEMQGFQAVTLNSFEVAAVPEPGTWAMMLGGLAGLGLMRKRGIGRAASVRI